MVYAMPLCAYFLWLHSVLMHKGHNHVSKGYTYTRLATWQFMKLYCIVGLLVWKSSKNIRLISALLVYERYSTINLTRLYAI